MVTASLAGRRAHDELSVRRGEVEAALSLGFDPRDARMEIAGPPSATALVPGLDQTKSVGLVTIPGAFVGMVLGGASVWAAAAMQMLKVDPEGFDDLDRRLLHLIIENFDGGPVGVESLAAALSEERGTLEDVIEPYLIQQGFLVRSARGRMATHKAYRHMGFRPKTEGGSLF